MKKEKRKFVIAGRSYSFTKDQILKEFGCPPEDVKEIWKAGTISGKRKRTVTKGVCGLCGDYGKLQRTKVNGQSLMVCPSCKRGTPFGSIKRGFIF